MDDDNFEKILIKGKIVEDKRISVVVVDKRGMDGGVVRRVVTAAGGSHLHITTCKPTKARRVARCSPKRINVELRKNCLAVVMRPRESRSEICHLPPLQAPSAETSTTDTREQPCSS